LLINQGAARVEAQLPKVWEDDGDDEDEGGGDEEGDGPSC